MKKYYRLKKKPKYNSVTESFIQQPDDILIYEGNDDCPSKQCIADTIGTSVKKIIDISFSEFKKITNRV